MNLENLKFPIGQFQYNPDYSLEDRNGFISVIENFPQRIETITQSLSVKELSWRYRPEGWSVKQVVHHCADSHINSFVRFKLTLTEDSPIIKPYEEQLWAEMVDELDDNLTASIQILKGIHHRWVIILKNLSEEDWDRNFIHPASQKIITLKEALGLYAWHCQHHFAHIQQALDNKGEFGEL